MSKVTKRSQNAAFIRAIPPKGPRGNFWTVRVEPMERMTVAEFAPKMLLVIQNHGPGKIQLNAGYGDRMVEIMPGKLRVTEALYQIDVKNEDDKPALIEMQFTPTVR